LAANAPLAVDLATADHPGSLLGRPLIRLGGTRNTPTAGEVTPQAPSRIEARLLPEIDAVERRVLPRFISPLVAEGAGADAREWWAHLSIVQKRAVISTPTEIRLMKFSRGAGSPSRTRSRYILAGNCLSKGFVYSDLALGCPLP
jgi:hypothetical protein